MPAACPPSALTGCGYPLGAVWPDPVNAKVASGLLFAMGGQAARTRARNLSTSRRSSSDFIVGAAVSGMLRTTSIGFALLFATNATVAIKNPDAPSWRSHILVCGATSLLIRNSDEKAAPEGVD